MSYLLDTNIISNIVKKNEIVKAKFWELKFREEKLFISVISYYEVKRGLLYASATRQISNFNGFCQEVTVLFLDDLEILERAAAIHADLRGKGTPLERRSSRGAGSREQGAGRGSREQGAGRGERS